MLDGILINFLVQRREIIKTGEKTLTSKAQRRHKVPKTNTRGHRKGEKVREKDSEKQ